MEAGIPTTEQQPDEVVVKRILLGEKKLYELIVRRYNQRLFRIGMTMLGIETEAEDAMQESYINAYKQLAGFEHRSSFGTWLTRIMINECIVRQKKKQRSKQAMEQQPNHIAISNPPDHALANKELAAVLQQAIQQLPDKYRLIFVLREIEHLSVRQASEVTGIEESNVKVRLNRAKLMLRETLGGSLKDHIYSFHLSRCDAMVGRVFQSLEID
ncbi:MAG TPA: sigma-70 family RNA polymerase sigma factor [Chitinophagaceae bacterium]|jgi:RNA polymerase sigma-70 factor (ECF subfamily)|nr:sigma-70 family RNA polymerase sigma factor [Chitinophagaceae bacterium]